MEKALGMFMLAAFTFSGVQAAEKPQSFPEEMTNEDLQKNDAQYQCEQFIQKTLDDPYKAKFEYFGMFPTHKNADGSYSVTASYSENEGEPQKKAECSMKKLVSGEWQLSGITTK